MTSQVHDTQTPSGSGWITEVNHGENASQSDHSVHQGSNCTGTSLSTIQQVWTLFTKFSIYIVSLINQAGSQGLASQSVSVRGTVTDAHHGDHSPRGGGTVMQGSGPSACSCPSCAQGACPPPPGSIHCCCQCVAVTPPGMYSLPSIIKIQLSFNYYYYSRTAATIQHTRGPSVCPAITPERW